MNKPKTSGMRLVLEGLSEIAQSGNIGSYEYKLMVPPDMVTGSNAHIELNPKGVEYLVNAAKNLAKERPDLFAALYPKDPKLASYKFLTKVGYHGAVNNVGVIPTYEGLEEPNPATAVGIGSVLQKWLCYFNEQFAVMKQEVVAAANPVKAEPGVVTTTTSSDPLVTTKSLGEVATDLFKDLDVRNGKKDYNNLPAVTAESLKDPETNSEFWANLWASAHDYALRKATVTFSEEGFLDNVYRWIGHELKRVSRTAELPKLGGSNLLKNVLESAGTELSQEGLFDFLFGKGSDSKKDEPPSMKRLEVLEEKAKKLKNPSALDLLSGKTKPPQELLDRLVAFAEKHPAPSMVFKQNHQLFEILIKLVKFPRVNPEAVAEDIREAKAVAELKNVVVDYINAMKPQCALMNAAKKIVISKPSAHDLFLDLTTNYQHNWEFIRSYLYTDYKGFDTYEPAVFAQYFGYPLGSLENQEGEGLEALIKEDKGLYDEYVAKLNEIDDACRRFEGLWSHGGGTSEFVNFAPAHSETDFLIHGRCWLLELALSLKTSTEELVQKPIEGNHMKHSFVAGTPATLPLSRLGFNCEELQAHNLESAFEEKESAETRLAERMSTATAQYVWAARLNELCSGGILQNIGNIKALAAKITNQAVADSLEEACNIGEYSEYIGAFAATPRYRMAQCWGSDIAYFHSQACYFISAVADARLAAAVKAKDFKAVGEITQQLLGSEWVQASATLPNASEYSPDTIREFLDQMAGPATPNPAAFERSCLSSTLGAFGLPAGNSASRVDELELQTLFSAEAYLVGEQLTAVKTVASLALKAASVLGVGSEETSAVVCKVRSENVSVTTKLLDYLIRAVGTPTETLSQEGMELVNKMDLIFADRKELKETEFRNLFGFGKKNPPTKVRESSKPASERRIGGLIAEQQEYLGKAIAKYHDIRELRDLCYKGYANEGKLYTAVAKAAGFAGYNHDHEVASYLKAQAVFADFYLDYAIEVQQPHSKLRKLVEQTVLFVTESLKYENVGTVVDEFNNKGDKAGLDAALRVGKRFMELNVVELYAQISTAKDTLRPKHQYDIGLLETQAMDVDDFDKHMGECSVQTVYTAYNRLCGALKSANSISDYVMSKNRDLGVLYSKIYDKLWAMADVLAYVLYSRGALSAAYANLIVSRIWFLESLVDGTYSTEGLFDFFSGKKGESKPKDEEDDDDDYFYDEIGEWLESTRYRGGEPNVGQMFNQHFEIPVKLLARPYKNRKAIEDWFTKNRPEGLPKLQTIFKRMDNATMAPNTAFLAAWGNSSIHGFMTKWVELSDALVRFKYPSGTEAEQQQFLKIWQHSGITDAVKKILTSKHENLETIKAWEFADLFLISNTAPVAEHYEDAAVGVNCVYAKAGVLQVYRKWMVDVLQGDDLLTMRLLGDAGGETLDPALEWQDVLSKICKFALRIGALSNRAA